MTNKTNGIDVSECFYFINHTPPKGQGDWCGAIHKGACKVYSKDCEYNKDCYFKQLRRLQEENEELKAKIAKFRWDNPYYDLYNNVVGQRDNLKKENEKLKKKKDEYFVMNLNYEVKISDLTQALEEIKEDLEQDTTCESRECGCDDYGECLKCVKETILDKIKEVLNDRD